MTEPTLVLTTAEREFLVENLKNVLKESRVEEHRTRAPSYREHILQREALIASLLQKLGASAD